MRRSECFGCTLVSCGSDDCVEWRDLQLLVGWTGALGMRVVRSLRFGHEYEELRRYSALVLELDMSCFCRTLSSRRRYG